MKRSPRFPSFDSQASLNEYKRDVSPSMSNLLLSRSNTSFTSISCGMNDNRSYSPTDFQRSFSTNYDIESPKASPRIERKNMNNRNCEFSSALPDFVQDHLVVEQIYNAFGSPPATTSPLTLEDEDSRPDFDILSRVRPEALDLTFDSNIGMQNRSRTSPVPLDLSNNSQDISLDMPNKYRRRMMSDGRRNPISADLTLDLTGTSIENRSSYIFPSSTCGVNDQHIPDCNKIQTLPDFLSDGPIHSSGRLADVAQDLPGHIDSPEDESMNTIMARLRLENERLRMELDESRRALSERTRRVRALERIIENERSNENQYSTTLSHSMEENLDRSNVSCNNLFLKTNFIFLNFFKFLFLITPETGPSCTKFS